MNKNKSNSLNELPGLNRATAFKQLHSVASGLNWRNRFIVSSMYSTSPFTDDDPLSRNWSTGRRRDNRLVVLFALLLLPPLALLLLGDDVTASAQSSSLLHWANCNRNNSFQLCSSKINWSVRANDRNVGKVFTHFTTENNRRAVISAPQSNPGRLVTVGAKSCLNRRSDPVEDSDAAKQLPLIDGGFELLRGLTEAFDAELLLVIRSPTENDVFDFIGLQWTIIVESFGSGSELELDDERLDSGPW